MSLSSILDEIQGDSVRPEDTPESSAPAVLEDIATEHLLGLPATVSKAKELANYAYVSRAFKAALSSPTMGHATATELFSMLPFSASRSPILTQAESAHNTKETATHYARFSARDNELIRFNAEVCELVEKMMPAVKELASVCVHYKAAIDEQITRLTQSPAMVVINGKTVNLLDADISQIAYVDTYTLGYKPYEGTLDTVFKNLCTHETLCQIKLNGDILLNAASDTSLLAVSDYVLRLCDSAISMQTKLQEILAHLTAVSLPASSFEYSETLIEDTLSELSRVKTYSACVTPKSSLAQSTLACLVFLV